MRAGSHSSQRVGCCRRSVSLTTGGLFRARRSLWGFNLQRCTVRVPEIAGGKKDNSAKNNNKKTTYDHTHEPISATIVGHLKLLHQFSASATPSSEMGS